MFLFSKFSHCALWISKLESRCLFQSSSGSNASMVRPSRIHLFSLGSGPPWPFRSRHCSSSPWSLTQPAKPAVSPTNGTRGTLMHCFNFRLRYQRRINLCYTAEVGPGPISELTNTQLLSGAVMHALSTRLSLILAWYIFFRGLLHNEYSYPKDRHH